MSSSNKAISFIGKICLKLNRIFDYAIRSYERTLFKQIGEGTYISRDCVLTHSTISIGKNTFIGRGCVLQSVHGEIEIGDNVMFGPGVHIHGGNHEFNHVGVLMKDVTKKPGVDGKVVIEDDVWVGANALILKGVRIGGGSVVGAGSVVTKDIPPYSIVVGNPAKVIKPRFSPEELMLHKQILSRE